MTPWLAVAANMAGAALVGAIFAGVFCLLTHNRVDAYRKKMLRQRRFMARLGAVGRRTHTT